MEKEYPTPTTSKPFMRRIQRGIKKTENEVSGDKPRFVVEDAEAVVEFDRIYRPYVLHILKDVYHFKETTTHSAEDIYHDVLAQLLDGLLSRFDFDGEHVGQGAFRAYLKLLIRGAYFRHVFPELIPELDADGNPVYLDEYEKDKKGRVKHDEDGNPIRKIKRITRTQFLSDQTVQAKAEGFAQMRRAQRKPHDGLSSPVVQIAVYAYIKCIYDKEINGKAKWRSEAMRSIFEEGRIPREVSEELQKAGTITDRRAFDTARSIFMSDWEALRYAMQDPVIESTVEGTPVAVTVTKTGKVELKIPKLLDKNGKGSYSRIVRRRMKVDSDALQIYLNNLRDEAISLVGKERVNKIHEAVVRSMLMLVQEADDKEVQRRARYYD